MKKYQSFCIRLLGSFALLILLAKSLDLTKAVELTKEVDIYWAFLALALIMGLRVLMAIRWKYALAYRNMHIPMTELLRITYISSSLGQFLPGGVGPDLVRGYQLTKNYGKLIDITTAILIDRIVGIYSMFFIALLGALTAELMGISTKLILPLFIFNALFLFALHIGQFTKEKLASIKFIEETKAKKILNVLWDITNREKLKQILLPIFVLSIFVQLIRCFVFYFLYLAYGHVVDIIYYIIFIPIMFAVTFIPISLGGLGVREGTLVYFFGVVSVPPEISASVGIISQVLIIAASLPGILLWLSEKNTTQKA